MQGSTDHVGIGTNSPDAKLHVYEATGGGGAGLLVEAGDSAGIWVHFANSTTGHVPGTSGVKIGMNSDEDFVIYDEEANFEIMQYDHDQQDLIFESEGQIFFNGSSTGTCFEFDNSQGSDTNDGIRIRIGGDNTGHSTSGYWVFCVNNNSGGWPHYFMGGIRGDGTSSRGLQFHNASDIRLKNNIRDTEKGLNLLMQIPVRDFEWNTRPGVTDTGWIAQEVEKILPEAVFDPTKRNEEKGLKEGDEEYEYKTMGTSAFIPLMMKSIQEQNELIVSLEKRIKELENKLCQ